MPSGAEHRERAYVAASRRTDRPPEARLASATKASQAHYERTGRHFKITMEIVLGDEMYREEEVPRPRPRNSSFYAGAAFPDRPDLAHKRSADDHAESFEVRERRVNQMFDLAFPWHRQLCIQQNQQRKQEEREECEDPRNGEGAGSIIPPTPMLSPTPHTPENAASTTTPATACNIINPLVVSADAGFLNSGMASGQHFSNAFSGPKDGIYSPPGRDGQPTLAEGLLVSTKSTHSPYPWTPDNDELASADAYGFPGQSLFPQMGSSGSDGPVSNEMVVMDENGNYYISSDDIGDHVASSSHSNMIMRSFNPTMSMDDAHLDADLFSSADPTDTPATATTTTTLAELMTDTTASPTATADQDYVYATSLGVFPPFAVDH